MSRTKSQSLPDTASVAFARTPRKKRSRAAVYTLPAQASALPKPAVPKPFLDRKQLLHLISAVWRDCTAVALHWWQWFQARRQAQLSAKRLRMCETLSLGEKRFVSIVQVDGQQFLLAGAAGTISLLAQLDSAPRFPAILQESSDLQRTQG